MKQVKHLKTILCRGFTLVEVLVASTLLSLVLTMCFSALYTGSHSWQAGEERVTRNEELRIGLEFIRKYLGQMSPMLQVIDNETISLFRGEADRIHFVSALPAHTGGNGLNLISLFIDDPEDVPGLFMLHQPALPGITVEDNMEEPGTAMLELIPGIEAMQFEYFGIKENKGEAEWFDTWENELVFPISVRVTFTTLDNQRYLPKLTIPVHIGDVRGMNQFVMNTLPSSVTDQQGRINNNAVLRSLSGGTGGGMGQDVFVLDPEGRIFGGGMAGRRNQLNPGGMGGNAVNNNGF